MSSYTLRDLDRSTVQVAIQRAKDAGTSLQDVLRACLTAYAEGRDSAGGYARAAALSPEERRDQARHAALARWGDRKG